MLGQVLGESWKMLMESYGAFQIALFWYKKEAKMYLPDFFQLCHALKMWYEMYLDRDPCPCFD